ncbi:hypothetical protein A8C56_13980 [Niabella ginsenosidivorans]|uniref:Uncharacterized protein n=1 Tax=Niabella ginsenosidivorans TaxID=1176587 RepID=A0A1A9I5G4_9BACT|nr:hypothetical protein [Niabella ginsenosidivorans]ANH81930.1 hypothetical protein A8C56_13980 [Niabella ginsenosidivorans]
MNHRPQNNDPAVKTGEVYQFEVPNARVLMYQVFAYCIILLNMLGQLFIDYRYNSSNLKVSIPVYLTLFVLLILWDVYLLRKKNTLQSLGIIILIIGSRWYQYTMGWGFVINMLLWFLYLVARRRLIIAVSKETVRYPSFPVKKIGWNRISNLILKDDILTIDLKNNKIYQHFVKYTDQVVDEEEFNEFCKRQLEGNRELRIEN